MSDEEVEFEILGKRITMPKPPDPPRFPWEGEDVKPKKAVRRFVRRKNQKWD